MASRSKKCPSCGGKIVRGTQVLLATSPAQRVVVCAGCAARAVLVLAPQQQHTVCEQCGDEPARFGRRCVAQQLGRHAAARKLGSSGYSRRQSNEPPAPAKPEEWGDA